MEINWNWINLGSPGSLVGWLIDLCLKGCRLENVGLLHYFLLEESTMCFRKDIKLLKQWLKRCSQALSFYLWFVSKRMRSIYQAKPSTIMWQWCKSQNCFWEWNLKISFKVWIFYGVHPTSLLQSTNLSWCVQHHRERTICIFLPPLGSSLLSKRDHHNMSLHSVKLALKYTKPNCKSFKIEFLIPLLTFR